MKLRQKSLLGPILFWLLGLLIPILFIAPKAQAADTPHITTDQVCIPPFAKTDDGQDYKVNGWLQASFMNRASIKLTYVSAGNCVAPASLDSSFFTAVKDKDGADITFAKIMATISGTDSTLIAVDKGDDTNIDYQAQFGQSPDDDTRVNRFGSVPAAMKDKYDSGVDAKVPLDSLAVFMQKTQVILSFEESAVGANCDQFDGSKNFQLLGSGSSPHWVCTNDSVDGKTGLVIGVNTINVDKFNVTFQVLVNGGATTVQSVYGAGSKTFSWCANSRFINNGCNNSNLILLDSSGAPATLDDINSLGTSTGDFMVAKYTQSSDKIDTATETAVVVQGIDVNNPPGGGGGGTNCAPGDTNCQASSTCLGSSSFGLEWLLCPILIGVSKAADGFVGLLASQLNFDVNSRLDDQSGAHFSWAAVKNIASIFLIILMLVMVISQAAGGQLFDAYTVRKMLPRLAIAVIVIQISWFFCKYAITLANDAGKGIGDILAAPFGGTSQLELDKLIGRLNPAWSVGANFAILGLFLLVLGTAGDIALWAVFLAAFVVLAAAVTALIVLLFRNIIIIILTIIAPIALILWVWPGATMQKYWKMWADNFLKVLMLFPLIMLIVYGGRVAAYVIATNHGGSPGLLDFLAILVAFFMPLFLVAKAWKWGGSALSAISRGVTESKALNAAKATGRKQLGSALNRESADTPYHENDPALAFNKRFKPNSWYNRGRLNPLRPLFTTGRTDEEGNPIGRRKLLSPTGRTVQRARLGHVFPTRYDKAQAVAKYQGWKEENDKLTQGENRREGEDANNEGGVVGWVQTESGILVPKIYQKGTPGGVAAYKQSLIRRIGHPFRRRSGMAALDNIVLSSFPEMGPSTVPYDAGVRGDVDSGGQEYTYFKGLYDRHFARWRELEDKNTRGVATDAEQRELAGLNNYNGQGFSIGNLGHSDTGEFWMPKLSGGSAFSSGRKQIRHNQQTLNQIFARNPGSIKVPTDPGLQALDENNQPILKLNDDSTIDIEATRTAHPEIFDKDGNIDFGKVGGLYGVHMYEDPAFIAKVVTSGEEAYPKMNGSFKLGSPDVSARRYNSTGRVGGKNYYTGEDEERAMKRGQSETEEDRAGYLLTDQFNSQNAPNQHESMIKELNRMRNKVALINRGKEGERFAKVADLWAEKLYSFASDGSQTSLSILSGWSSLESLAKPNDSILSDISAQLRQEINAAMIDAGMDTHIDVNTGHSVPRTSDTVLSVKDFTEFAKLAQGKSVSSLRAFGYKGRVTDGQAPVPPPQPGPTGPTTQPTPAQAQATGTPLTGPAAAAAFSGQTARGTTGGGTGTAAGGTAGGAGTGGGPGPGAGGTIFDREAIEALTANTQAINRMASELKKKQPGTVFTPRGVSIPHDLGPPTQRPPDTRPEEIPRDEPPPPPSTYGT